MSSPVRHLLCVVHDLPLSKQHCCALLMLLLLLLTETAGQPFIRPISQGEQSFDTDPSEYPVSQPAQKLEGLAQAAGEARYLDDLPNEPGMLFAAFMVTNLANATLSAIDTTAVLQAPGMAGPTRTVPLIYLEIQHTYSGSRLWLIWHPFCTRLRLFIGVKRVVLAIDLKNGNNFMPAMVAIIAWPQLLTGPGWRGRAPLSCDWFVESVCRAGGKDISTRIYAHVHFSSPLLCLMPSSVYLSTFARSLLFTIYIVVQAQPPRLAWFLPTAKSMLTRPPSLFKHRTPVQRRLF